MILPTKGIEADQALLALGAEILRDLRRPKTVSSLWAQKQKSREKAPERLSFDWFVLALDLLYLLGAVEYRSGKIHRASIETSGRPS